MRKYLTGGVGILLILGCLLAWQLVPRGEAADKDTEAMIVHDVYFSLKDNSPEAKQKLIGACKKYLTEHSGEVFFATGPLADEFKREVNDRDFDVALHIVFKNKAAHDTYQDHKRHHQFINENKDNWKKVRVFDSLATK
jgi:hypothetical protein